MNNQTVRSVLLFFYFSLLDEKQAIAASTETVKRLKRRMREKEFSESDHDKSVVFYCNQVRQDMREKKKLLWAKNSLESSWIFPKGVDLGPWREFSTDEKQEVVDAVIYSKILRFNDLDISNGLGITKGTLRYRIGNGIRHLGVVVQPGAPIL